MAFQLSGYVNVPTSAGVAVENAELTAGIDASTLTIPVDTIAFLPPSTTRFDIRIGDEFIPIIGRSGLNLTAESRGAYSTTAAVHSSGDAVLNPLTAASLARHPRNATTAGDTWYLDADGAPARLAAPANGDYVWRWTGGVPSYVAAPTGTVTGTGAANRVAFWSGASALTSDANLTWDGTTFGMGAGSVLYQSESALSAFLQGYTGGVNLITRVGAGTALGVEVDASGAGQNGVGIFAAVLGDDWAEGIGLDVYAEGNNADVWGAYMSVGARPGTTGANIRGLFIDFIVSGGGGPPGTYTSAVALAINDHVSVPWTYAIDFAGKFRVDGSGNIVLSNGVAFRSTTTTGQTALLQAYDVDDATYRTFGTLTNGNTPSFALAAPSGGSLTGNFSTLQISSVDVVTLTGAQALSNKTGNISQWTNDSGYLTSVTAHNLLSATHGDTTAGSVARGDLITGQGASPKWVRLAKGTANQVLAMDGTATDIAWTTLAGGGDALTTNPLSQFAATTSLQLLGVISDETGSGALVFAETPTLVTPVLGAATGTSLALARGTITDPSAVLSGTVTWNDAADTFDLLDFTATSTASAAASRLMRFRVGSADIFTVRKDGRTDIPTNGGIGYSILVSGQVPVGMSRNGSVGGLSLHGGGAATPGDANSTMVIQGATSATPVVKMDSGTSFQWSSSNVTQTGDLLLLREGAATLQMGADVNGSPVPQTFKAHDGITGTNIAGAHLTLASGRGTGDGTISTVLIQTPALVGSGTTAQTLTTRVTIDSSGLMATGYKSSDGTAGATGGPWTSVTVKNGLVVSGS